MEQMYTQRKFERYDLDLEAQCITAGNAMSISCRVAEISRVGASMYLLMNERLKAGQSVMLQIPVPGKLVPISAIVKLSWFKKVEGVGLFNFASGGKITFIKAEDRDALLSFAYRRLIDQEKNA